MLGALVATAGCGLAVVGVADGPSDAGGVDAAAVAQQDATAPTDGTTQAEGATTPDATQPDATPTIDATTAPPDAAVPDAAAPDARVDAAPDAAPDAAVATTFCTGSPATFCSDFDRPADTTAAAAGWTLLPLLGGSSVGLVNVAHSSPRALRAVAAGGNAAAVQKTVTVNTSLRVDYWVRYAGLPSGAPLVASVMITPPNPPGEDFFFFASNNRSYFQQFGDFYSPMLGAMSENTWHHVVISITTNDSHISATVDGTTYWNNATFPHAWPRPTNAMIEIGAARLYQATSAEVWIDDVVITAN